MNRSREENKILALFYVVFIISILPIICFRFFPTVDGPAHLYNAHIIRELLFGDSVFYSNYFHFNTVPVPNWTGHMIAVISGLIVPAWMSEKLLLLLIVLGMPVAIINLAKAYDAKISWQIFLLIPFTYSIILYLGFFNFLLGLTLMFWFLSKVKKVSNNLKLQSYCWLVLFAILLYFSHIMIFYLTIGFTVLDFLFRNLKTLEAKLLFKSTLKLFSLFIPGIIFSLVFFAGRDLNGFKKVIDVLSYDQLTQYLMDGAPLMGLNGEVESPFTKIFAGGVLCIFIAIAFIRIKNKLPFFAYDVFLLNALVCLIFYFMVPDGFATGGFISLRLLLLFFLFMVLWILSNNLPAILSVTAAVLGIVVGFSTLPYRYQATADLNTAAGNMISVANTLDDKTVLLPLNYSNNWLHTNLSNYIGASKNVIVLDNYEAVLNEFPLVWNMNKRPELLAGNFTQSLNPSVSIRNYEQLTNSKINFVSRWQFNNSENDSTKLETETELRHLFKKLKRIGSCDLFY